MRKIVHHPKDQTLAAFAAGGLDEANSVVIATHLQLCCQCQTKVRDFETIGGACLMALQPQPMRKDALDSFWLRAGKQQKFSAAASKIAANDQSLTATTPLSSYILEKDLDELPWRSIAPGLSQFVLSAEGYRNGTLRLFKIQPGTKIPDHAHRGNEFTLILKGAYKDKFGIFGPGDLADMDENTRHEPEALEKESCICLISTDAPLIFKSVVGKIVQPFIGL